MSSTASPIDLSVPPAPPSPAITSTTAPSRRQSCDRCHSQKLRCTPYEGSRTGACSRCFRHGTQCVYSLSRPKGRPSLHHYKGETVFRPPRRRRETVVQPLTPEEDGYPSIHEPGMTYSCQLSTPPYASGTMVSCQSESEPILASGPYLELMPGAWLCHALQPDVCSWDTTHAQYQPIDLSNLMSNTQIDMQLGFHDILQDLCIPEIQGDWLSDTAHDSSQLRQLPLCSFNNAITTLSQLAPRVQALYNKSRKIFENRELSQNLGDIDRRVPTLLLNATVFKLVVIWLLNPFGDTTGDSNVLDSLLTSRNEAANGETLVELLSCSSKLRKATQSLHEELGTRSNKAVCDNSVAQHLVVACHLLLLSSFGAVLGALQDGADAVQGSTAPGLADLRLAVVVQLCSYLFVRQCRVVDAYLEANSGPKSSAGYPKEGTEDERVIQELKAQVDSCVAWFQSLWYGAT
jgi:hypothetical protein